MFSHLTEFARHRAGLATGLIFTAFGFVFGSWAASIPFIKQKFGLDEAQMGLLLLALQGGILIANPFSVPLLRRFGALASTFIALLLAAFLFIWPVVAPTVWLTAFSLALAGAAFSWLNIAVNTCATNLEASGEVRLMSTCHGLWSTGAMAGSAICGLATGFGLARWMFFALIFLLEILLVWWLAEPMREIPGGQKAEISGDEKPAKKRAFIMPNAALWTLIIISLCTNLTEGTMADWSAIYMREVVAAPELMAAWGFSAYAFFMAAGRFVGDGLIANFGNRRTLQAGGLVAAFGFLLAVFVPDFWAVLLGFSCVGAGVSIGAPILYAAAARAPGMEKGAGLAALNTFAMLGFFGGPVLIGFLAKAFSLPMAFLVVAGAALVWVWKSGAKSVEN